MKKIVVASRFFEQTSEKLSIIQKFATISCASFNTLVAINTATDKTDSEAYLETNFPGVAVPVTPWGKFVQPLNALVMLTAEKHGADYLLLASAEFPPTPEQADRLLQHMDDRTLVVGARFSEHKRVDEKPITGKVPCDGSTTPWNTFALWNMKHLSKIGFPLMGDSPYDRSQAGVEEAVTIGVYQRMFPGNCEAKVVPVPGIGGVWNTEGWSAERHTKHAQKMASKVSRPANQLLMMGIPAGHVIHLVE